jgi:asparagine N-glycosylation enzyme membrane subunit Stt3
MKHKTLILLSAAIFAGVLLRILPAWGQVFAGDHVNFVGPDSWYHAITMRGFISAFPDFTFNIHQIYDAFVGIFYGMTGTGISFFEHTVVFLPVFLFVLTVLMVFVIGKEISGKPVGIIAAFVFCLLPGEYLNRSMLGSIDHHVVEVFLTTAAVMFLILASKKTKWLPLFLALAVIFAFVYSRMWLGYLLFIPVFIAFIFPINKKVGLGLAVLAIMYGIYLVNTGYFSLQPVQTAQTTTEAVPGWANILILSHIVLTFVLAFTVGKNVYRWPLIAWSILLAGATFWQLRFDYYLIIPLSLLVGIAGFRLWGFVLKGDVIKKRAGVIMVGAVGLCFFTLAMLPAYIALPKLKLPVPSPEWRSTLEWVKENTPKDSTIIAWWDFGYWIEYIAERPAYITPSQEAERLHEVAMFFNGGLYSPTVLPPKSYVIIDRATAYDFTKNIQLWDYGQVHSYTFAKIAYDGYLPDGWKLVHGPEVKVWEVK